MYKEESLAGTHPSEEFTFHMAAEEHERFLKLVEAPAALAQKAKLVS